MFENIQGYFFYYSNLVCLLFDGMPVAKARIMSWPTDERGEILFDGYILA